MGGKLGAASCCARSRACTIPGSIGVMLEGSSKPSEDAAEACAALYESILAESFCLNALALEGSLLQLMQPELHGCADQTLVICRHSMSGG